jgi:hypothetical protein
MLLARLQPFDRRVPTVILRIRRARGWLALCAVPSGLVWAALVAASVLLHSSSDALTDDAAPDGSARPHLHQLSLTASHGVVFGDGPCAACALEGNPAAVAGLELSIPEALPAIERAVRFVEGPAPRTPPSSVLGRAPPRS